MVLQKSKRIESTFLTEIFAAKRNEVAQARQKRPFPTMQKEAQQAAPPLDFVQAILERKTPLTPALIAEIKFASPSKGVLLAERDPTRLARCYQQSGAAAISVLTDEIYFQGHLDYLAQVARLTLGLPLLRKDFIFDPYQVYEARAAGADAVLLIAAGLTEEQLIELHALTISLGMTALVEIHDEADLEIALACQPRLLGINNRDLHTFQVDLNTSLRLRSQIPAGICLLAESGIAARQDVIRLAQAGVDGMLIGEALVTAADISAAIGELLGD